MSHADRDRTISDVTACAALTLLWVGAVWIARPSGDLPLNDDWAYSASVRTLIQEHILRFNDATAMPLAVQTVWGAAWSLVFGSSETVLRLSTAFLALATLWIFYGLLRLLGGLPRSALLLASCLAASPVFFNLSLTFMTDVPFLCLFLASIALLSRWLLCGGARLLAFGLIAGLLASFIRQLAVAAFVGFALATVVRKGLRPRSIAMAALPLLTVCLALWAYGVVLRHTTGVPALYATKSTAIMETLAGLSRLRLGVLKAPVFNLATLWFHASLGLAPSFFLFGAFRRRAGRPPLWVTGVVTGVGTVLMFMVRARLLTPGDILIAGGAGPLTLTGPDAPTPRWWAAALVGVAGVGLWTSSYLLVNLIALFRRLATPARAVLALLGGTLVAYLAPILLALGLPIFDRYSLPAIAVLLVIGSLVARPRARDLVAARVSAVAVGLTAVFAIAATHDYLSWNRARWAAVQRALDTGVAPAELDAGFEYRGRQGLPLDAGPPLPYRLTFTPIAGYRTVQSFAVRRLLCTTPASIQLLRKDGGS